MGAVSSVSAIQRQFCNKKSRWKLESCPLSGIKKRLLLRGWFSITAMLISQSITLSLSVVERFFRFSEDPLSETQMYTYSLFPIYNFNIKKFLFNNY